jgi:hypothetical protein
MLWQLVEAGLSSFAYDLWDRGLLDQDDYTVNEDLFKSIREAPMPKQYSPGNNITSYDDFCLEAWALESSLDWPAGQPNLDEPSERRQILYRTRSWLKSGYKELRMQGLYHISRHGLDELLPEIEPLLQDPEPDVAWNARRALRAMGHGRLEQRRAHAASWH